MATAQCAELLILIITHMDSLLKEVIMKKFLFIFLIFILLCVGCEHREVPTQKAFISNASPYLVKKVTALDGYIYSGTQITVPPNIYNFKLQEPNIVGNVTIYSQATQKELTHFQLAVDHVNGNDTPNKVVGIEEPAVIVADNIYFEKVVEDNEKATTSTTSDSSAS